MSDLTLEQKLEQDIKAALLSGDKRRATTLRGLKAVLLNVKVAQGKRDIGLNDDEVLQVFAKESKKRQESADLYKQGGDEARAEAESAEKAIIDAYLPARLGETEIAAMIDQVINEIGAEGPAALGQVIGKVRAEAGPAADGAVIARIAKEKLQ